MHRRWLADDASGRGKEGGSGEVSLKLPVPHEEKRLCDFNYILTTVQWSKGQGATKTEFFISSLLVVGVYVSKAHKNFNWKGIFDIEKV